MFGPVITTEPHPAFSGARTHSNNAAEMSAMIEALSFLGPRGPVARDVDSCIYDSKHAAGVCLGTIQARTHVQLAPACQRSMLCAQHWPRLAMQHVYGDAGNLDDECADHAAALGSLGLISSHNVATLWVRHNFDTSAHCGDCNSISEVLEKLHSIRTEATSLPQDGSKCGVPHRVLCDCHARICITCGFALSLFFPRTHFTLQERQRKAQLRQFLPRRALVTISRTTCGILSWNCSVTSRLAAYLYFSSKKPTWPKLHSLVILLLTSSATRKVHTIQLLHWAPLPKETCLLFLT